MLELRNLKNEDQQTFLAAVKEFEEEGWLFALEFNPECDFSAYVARLESWSRGRKLPKRFVTNSFWVGVVKGKIIGRVSIRHELNDFLLTVGGHIGFCVVPSERRKGYATEMLRQALLIAGDLHLKRALVTCDVDNLASVRVIEANGGVQENTFTDSTLRVPKMRYWIELTSE